MGGEACVSHPERVSNNWGAPRPRPLKKKNLCVSLNKFSSDEDGVADHFRDFFLLGQGPLMWLEVVRGRRGRGRLPRRTWLKVS